MAAQPQLQFFNPDTSTQDEISYSFHLFLQLITELRWKIWRHAFQRQRIISVHLQAGEEQVINGAPKWIWGDVHSTGQQPYGVFVGGYQLMNKFLRVSREARCEVLKFYRVHIPCRLTTKPQDFGQAIELDETKMDILYFNPEHDFLHITSMMAPLATTDIFFVDFLYHLKTVYDPCRIGLLNLVLDSNDLSRLSGHNHGSTPIPEPFLETMQHLQEVFFLRKQAFGRLNISLLSGTSSTEIFFTRSFPIMPLTPNFERLGRDPRPISQDLRKLNIDDPRAAFSSWQSLLRVWGVPLPNCTSYKFLVAHELRNPYDRATARKALEWEDESWRHPELGKGRTYELEDLENVVKPAFGFWLFPVDAFGPFKQNGDPMPIGETNGREYKDLSRHYPELALSTLL